MGAKSQASKKSYGTRNAEARAAAATMMSPDMLSIKKLEDFNHGKTLLG